MTMLNGVDSRFSRIHAAAPVRRAGVRLATVRDALSARLCTGRGPFLGPPSVNLRAREVAEQALSRRVVESLPHLIRGRTYYVAFASAGELGVALGLPHDMVYRHPFPGPGLGVRILGEVKKALAHLREETMIWIRLRLYK